MKIPIHFTAYVASYKKQLISKIQICFIQILNKISNNPKQAQNWKTGYQ